MTNVSATGLHSLVEVSDILYFFCSGAREREEASEEVAGGPVF